MTLVPELARLLRGESSAALLHNCRLEGFGGEHFGQEAIMHAFRAQPRELSDGANAVEGTRHVALFDDDVALFADVHEGRLVRLWRLGGGVAGPTEGRVNVPFDADLRQQRGDVLWRPQDHPGLDASLVSAVERAGHRVLATTGDAGAPAYRARGFAIRAFSNDGVAAALFAVHRLGGAAVRTSGFSYAAAYIAGARTTVVRDAAGEQALERREWRTTL